jgi:pimeloyl-ACP methyl ester carboxylesterase
MPATASKISASEVKRVISTAGGSRAHGPVVVMTHGWGSSKQGGLKRVGSVVDHAKEIILWDLPGHGNSVGGSKLGALEHRDLLSLLEMLGVDTPVVLYGWSMGAGICLKTATQIANKHALVGLICESPYVHAITPARNVIALRGFPTKMNLPVAMAMLGMRFGLTMKWNEFARDQLAGSLEDLRMLVLHGDLDPVCPIADAESIVAAATNASFARIEGGGHNNLWIDEQYAAQMSSAVSEFLGGLTTTS